MANATSILLGSDAPACICDGDSSNSQFFLILLLFIEAYLVMVTVTVHYRLTAFHAKVACKYMNAVRRQKVNNYKRMQRMQNLKEKNVFTVVSEDA